MVGEYVESGLETSAHDPAAFNLILGVSAPENQYARTLAHYASGLSASDQNTTIPIICDLNFYRALPDDIRNQWTDSLDPSFVMRANWIGDEKPGTYRQQVEGRIEAALDFVGEHPELDRIVLVTHAADARRVGRLAARRGLELFIPHNLPPKYEDFTATQKARCYGGVVIDAFAIQTMKLEIKAMPYTNKVSQAGRWLLGPDSKVRNSLPHSR